MKAEIEKLWIMKGEEVLRDMRKDFGGKWYERLWIKMKYLWRMVICLRTGKIYKEKER